MNARPPRGLAPDPRTRRRFLRDVAAGLGAAATLGPALACGPFRHTELDYAAAAEADDLGLALAPTPACDDGDAPATLHEIEGPFYTPHTPERRSLRTPGVSGPPIRLVGRVLDTRCRPIPGAVLDFWQANPEGEYDNEGMTLRGHQYADTQGAWLLETVRPGRYQQGFVTRTPHIHLKAQAPGTRLLTTQLYFPDLATQNADDRFFHEELLVRFTTEETGDEVVARFDLVLERS